MPYNQSIDDRIEKVVSRWENTEKKKMFGGTCHLMNGNMVGGVYKDYMILRLGEEEAGRAMEHPHVRVFDITGRPMKGWIMIEEDGFKTDEELEEWLAKARTFVETLPVK
jgi:TfoX/Sxy family transcriptional regulator of competence genes